MYNYTLVASMIGYHMKKMMWSKMLYEANISRCHWVTDDPIYITYHDEEWGNLKHFTDDHYLFEMLTLEGAQAGLSWITILKRRRSEEHTSELQSRGQLVCRLLPEK